MARRLRRLSGADVVRILKSFGFETFAQRGNHIKLRRMSADGGKQTLVVPLHDELDRGTLRAVFRQAGRYVAEDDLRPHFYAP